MRRSTTLALQLLVALIGLAALAFLLVEPHFEGRNARATLFQIYFQDPMLAYAYAASIPFFMALAQAWKVLGFVRHEKTNSPATLKALRTLKLCALVFAGLVALSLLFMPWGDPDDRPQGLVMRLVVAVPAVIVAAAAAKFERKQSAA